MALYKSVYYYYYNYYYYIEQTEALEAVKSIEVSGVTNMSAGIFTAINQFNVPFAKRSVHTLVIASAVRCYFSSEIHVSFSFYEFFVNHFYFFIISVLSSTISSVFT